MPLVCRLDLLSCTASPYAAELRRGVPDLRFGPALETQYARADLQHSRTLIRVACLVAAVVCILRLAERWLAAGPAARFSLDLLLVVLGSMALASIAWSASFERLYHSWARIVVPARNAVIAYHIGELAARGEEEMLMLLPLALIGPFILSGTAFSHGIGFRRTDHSGLCCGDASFRPVADSCNPLLCDVGPRAAGLCRGGAAP